eukprot:gene31906-6175_t
MLPQVSVVLSFNVEELEALGASPRITGFHRRTCKAARTHGGVARPRSDGTASEAGLKANGKAKTEPKPTDALMVKQWSSRNP